MERPLLRGMCEAREQDSEAILVRMDLDMCWYGVEDEDEGKDMGMELRSKYPS